MVTKETALNLDQRAINISGFISARANELQEFTNILKTKMQNLNKLPFQLLPKHMRRRAMSHNKYRIPSRVREKIKEEDLLLKKPSRCRKSLRKSRLLLSSYARRSQKNKWLETHIWHAKRMNMRNYFGYKIAGTCGAKSNRAAYRYFKTDCLAYDLSYTLVFEVKSPYRERINDFVGSFVDKPSHEWNQFCNNQEIVKGAKKGTLTLWAGNPRKLVQRCEYIYRPRVNEESDYQIWFFLHPSCKDNLEQILSYSKSNDSIKCKLYDNCFNLFHIIGPDSCEKAYNLLQNIWNAQWNFDTFISKHPITKAMKSITDPGVYPRNFVFHLSTEKRTEAKLLGAPHRIDNRTELSGLEDQEKINELMVELASYRYTLSENAKNLELWDFPEVPPENEYSLRFKNSTRGRFTHRKLQKPQKPQKPVKTEVKNGKRKRNGKPQEEEPTTEKANQNPEALTTERARETAPVFEEEKIEEVKPAENVMEEEKPVPNFPDKKIEIVLMHDEGEPQTCQGAGIKILVPCGQGLYIWRLLNYIGCKALGLQEYHHVLNETRKFVFPQDFPYSNGYELYREVTKEEKLTKYFNKPPAKRINLIKIGSPFAFASDWELIIRENSIINNPLIPISLKENLVPVYVKMVKRRYPVDQAMICVPNSEELEKIKHYESQTKGGQDIIHTEPLNKCEFPVALKNVSREDYLDKLKEIKVSRKVGGFITTGNLSYRFATGCGKGYLVRSLLEELKPFEIARSQVRDTFESSLPYKSAFYMLIRNPSSRYYYACRVYVLNA